MIYKDIFESVQISNWNVPFNKMGSNDPELGLANSYSKISCLILYLYSMELGNRPLYAEANRIAMEMDLNHM